ncbi:MAG: DUF3795 domain-containing protein [Thermodesulfobacteriota bacterium]
MAELIACCGLVCSNCPTFIATQNDDDAAREKTAALYAQRFGLSFQKEDINCDGCRSEGGRQIGYCRTCEIRRCCLGKSLANCGACPEQPCDLLRRFHEFSAEAKSAFAALK